jgi:uncharacterized protein YciI
VPHFLIRLHPSRSGFLDESTPEENLIVGEHFEYLQGLARDGIVLLAGRTLNTDPSSFGVVILETQSEKDAQELMDKDPAVHAGVFCAELYPYRIALVSPALQPLG